MGSIFQDKCLKMLSGSSRQALRLTVIKPAQTDYEDGDDTHDSELK
jgi:hypothetical protein